MTFFPQISRQNFRDQEKDPFSLEKLSQLKKSEGKNTIFYSFSVLLTVTVAIYKVLSGFIAQETKGRGDYGTAKQDLKK